MASSSFPSLTDAPRAFPLPMVAEDTLIYAVHLPKTSTSSTSSSAVYEDPAAFATLVNSFVDSLIGPTWLWNKDSWELKPAEQDRKLEGRMRVGDAVDDEWLVVWLLREVSRKWPELIISIRDTDGEFLLIEAANELPKWVTPSNAENRLWLHDSHLHLLPLEVRSPISTRPTKAQFDAEGEDDGYPEDLEGWVNEKDALRFTRSGQYRAPREVEEAVWNRISCYPEAMSTHHHLTNAYLPEGIAKALTVAPELVQKAVEGFYTRDPAQLRAASRLTHFPSSPAVLAPVRMTRAAYAQLQGQVIHPSKAFGPEWHVKAAEDHDQLDKVEKEKRWRDIGIKLTLGFEIMYKEGGKRERAGRPQASAEDRESDAEYQAFIDRLAKVDFFGSETRGSQAWRLKEAEAAKGWHDLKSSDSAQRPSFASQVDAAVAAAANIPRSTYEVNELTQEDSEEWLTVDPDELDGMMMRASGRDRAERPAEGSVKAMDLDDTHAQALSDLAAKVGKFVEGEGDIEGARFDDELSDEEMPLDDDDDDDDDDEENNAMSVDEKQERMRALVPELPASEWGRKPLETEPSITSKPVKLPKTKPVSPPKMRAPILPRDNFDGHIEESDDESDEDEPKAPAGSMGRIIGDMAWGGPDDETKAARVEEVTEEDEAREAANAKRSVRWEDEGGAAREEDDEMDPDMQKEEEEFLKFTREQLGINDEMWQSIMADREARGASIPETVRNPSSTKLPKISQPDPSMKKHKLEPLRSSNVSSERFGSVAPATPFAPASRPKPEARIENGLNMDLDSFDKVMEAMDDELAKAKKSAGKAKKQSGPSLSEAIAQDRKKPSTSASNPLPPLPTEADLEALDEDELMEMDRELRAALKSAGIEDSDDDMDGEFDPEEAKELQGDAREQYKMMRDFLESYKSQGGESGVVGNLFGRLGESK